MTRVRIFRQSADLIAASSVLWTNYNGLVDSVWIIFSQSEVSHKRKIGTLVFTASIFSFNGFSTQLDRRPEFKTCNGNPFKPFRSFIDEATLQELGVVKRLHIKKVLPREGCPQL